MRENEVKIKVRDHNDVIGEFREAARRNCNFNYKIARFISIYMLIYLLKNWEMMYTEAWSFFSVLNTQLRY